MIVPVVTLPVTRSAPVRKVGRKRVTAGGSSEAVDEGTDIDLPRAAVFTSQRLPRFVTSDNPKARLSLAMQAALNALKLGG